MARHAQSTQNNNFIISLQYLKENVKDGVDFSLLIIVKRYTVQSDTVIFDVCG